MFSTMGLKNLLSFEYPTVLNTPYGTHDIPPRYSNFKGWYPPTVLNTPTVLKISPHGTHDIPHGTEHPHSTEHPHGTAHTLYRVFLSGTFQTEDIALLIWNLSNLDHSLILDRNGMPYKCM